jgi:hypothetical protein
LTLSVVFGWWETRLALGLTGLMLLSVAHAQDRGNPPVLNVPVRCHIGADCFVQNYVDVDPGSGMQDFACGRLTYDGHKGVDFRLTDLAAMRQGVTVVAAAAGTVTRTRDGVADVSIRQSGRAPAGKEAGNAVVIDHGNGWETQYSHLLQGSVAVRPGDRVEVGRPLGRIGLSGNTEFPHVDFGVRRAGQGVDPYTGRVIGTTVQDSPALPAPALPACNSDGGIPIGTLWSDQARRTLVYRPSALLGAGLARETPKADTARDGGYGQPLPAGPGPLGVWVELMGGRRGDAVTVEAIGPNGQRLHRLTGTVPRPLAVLFINANIRPPNADPWPAGVYRVMVALHHEGETVLQEERRVELRGSVGK